MREKATKIMAALFVVAAFIGITALLAIKSPVMWYILCQLATMTVGWLLILRMLQWLFTGDKED